MSVTFYTCGKVTLEPLERLPAGVSAALEAEAIAVSRFLAPAENS